MHFILLARALSVSRQITPHSISLVNFILRVFPRENKEKLLRVPKTGDDIRAINDVIQQYAQTNFVLVLVTYISIFINFVACGIPGTGVLCILAGPVFGTYKGFLLVHSCAVAGASLNYFLSMKLGSGFMESKFPGKLAWFQQKIEENKKDLFFYVLSLRLAPVVPNVIMNMASGCVGLPFKIFLLSSAIGQIPFTLLYIKTGNMLDKITSGGVLDFNVSSIVDHCNFDTLFWFRACCHFLYYVPSHCYRLTCESQMKRALRTPKKAKMSNQKTKGIRKDEMRSN